MCRGTEMPAWQALALRDLLDVPGVSIPLLIVDPTRRERPRPHSSIRRMRHALWRVYNNRWVARRSSALQPVDVSSELRDAVVLEARAERRGEWSEHFTEADLALIRSHAPDVILRFAYGIIRGEILDVAPYGVWSFHHGDIERYRGGPPAFWEIVRGDYVSGAVLQRLTARLDGGVVLRSGWFSTVRHSYVRNADRVRFGGAHWPAQVCRDLLAGRLDRLRAAPTGSDAPIDHNPSNGQMSRFLIRLVLTWITHQAEAFFRTDRWRIGVVDLPIQEVRSAEELEPTWLRVELPRCEYLADPFAEPGTGAILAEHFSYRARTGRLVRVRRRDATIQSLGAGFSGHASYPLTIEHDGRALCVPQITGVEGVRVYALEGDVLSELWTIVPGVRALDPTLVHHDGRWWLFFTDGDRGAMSHLHVWHARALEGPWEPHSDNPVKVDVRSARPAGTPFTIDGVLHRPAQDCSKTYGGGLAINRVDTLTPEEFREVTVATIRPHGTWSGAQGCHTLSAAGDRTLIDAKWAELCPWAALGELRARARLLHRRA